MTSVLSHDYLCWVATSHAHSLKTMFMSSLFSGLHLSFMNGFHWIIFKHAQLNIWIYDLIAEYHKTFLILTFMSITQDFSNEPFTDFKYNHSIKRAWGRAISQRKITITFTPLMYCFLTWAFDWTFFPVYFSIYKSGNPKKSRIPFCLLSFLKKISLVFFLFGNICKYTLSTLFYECIFLFSVCMELCKILFHMFKKPKL